MRENGSVFFFRVKSRFPQMHSQYYFQLYKFSDKRIFLGHYNFREMKLNSSQGEWDF